MYNLPHFLTCLRSMFMSDIDDEIHKYQASVLKMHEVDNKMLKLKCL